MNIELLNEVARFPVVSAGKTLAIVIVGMATAATTTAQSDTRFRLADAIREALARNPEIAAAERRYGAARQRPAQERSLPDPVLSAGYRSSGNPLPGSGLGVEPTANIGWMLTQEIPFPGKLDLKATMAAREADAGREEVDAARLDVAARVKQTYYRLAYTYAADEVLARNRELLETLLKASESRYAVGHTAQQDVIRAHTQATILELQQARLARERSVRQGELNALFNRTSTAPLGRPDDLAPVAFDRTFESLVALAAERAPMLRRDRLMIDRAKLGLDSARLEFKPDFALSGGYAYMGAMPPMYELRFDIKLPLQRQRRAAAVVEQQQLVEAARHAYDVNRLSIEERLREDYEIAVTSARLAQLYHDTVLAQTRLALESSMSSYQTGRVDFLTVLTNFGSVLENEMTYFDELASFHAAISRLEEMTGTPLLDGDAHEAH